MAGILLFVDLVYLLNAPWRPASGPGPSGARPRRGICIEDGVEGLQGPPGAEIAPEGGDD